MRLVVLSHIPRWISWNERKTIGEFKNVILGDETHLSTQIQITLGEKNEIL